MMRDQEREVRQDAGMCSWDLEQIKDAVGALRASCPGSVLADLVEEKIRLIERGEAIPPPAFALRRAAAGGR
jgi:hypothetical protein